MSSYWNTLYAAHEAALREAQVRQYPILVRQHGDGFFSIGSRVDRLLLPGKHLRTVHASGLVEPCRRGTTQEHPLHTPCICRYGEDLSVC